MALIDSLRRLGARWLRPALWALAIGSVTGAVQSPAQVAPEYQVKAVFLFNFAQFVEWPASAFPDPAAPLVIGVLGEDPFGEYLDQTVQGETINSHPLAVQRYKSVEEISTCHILFVSRAEEGHLEEVFAGLRGRSILTVGDFEGFASRGGMIRFVTSNNRIRLRINLEAARADSLTISSKLLRPAEIVSAGKD